MTTNHEGGLREAVARIIRPEAWERLSNGLWRYRDALEVQFAALAKADLILSSLKGDGGEGNGSSRRTSASPSFLAGGKPTEGPIKHMVDRFLSWRLPQDFNPDAGISFKREFNENTPWPMKHEPVGTNLLDARQAEAMVRHLLDGLPENSVGAAEGEVGRWVYRRIETLMDAKAGTPEAAELAYLATVAESVEEWGEEHCGGESLAPFPAESDTHSPGCGNA